MSLLHFHLWLVAAIGWSFIVLGLGYLFFGLDDLFIDLVAWWNALRPEELEPETMMALRERKERRIAVIVPAWKEGAIIKRMLSGNCRRLEYGSYTFFVGVYPNDPLTGPKVDKVHRRFQNVRSVMNDRPGPTSKGQVLNRVIRQIFEFEEARGIRFDAFLMQDAEDIIHPKILQLVNEKLDDYDFIQTPVFSFEVNRGQLVAATYMDEFAEHHTKDILVRNHLGAAVPSAGVGTALSRELVLRLIAEYGDVFNEGSLTEDYELGVRVHALGFRPHFACCYYRPGNASAPEYIATREYFPKRFSRSVRQKTRWSLGICLQGWRNLGWKGSLGNRYFLYRDRKGIGVNIAVFLGYPCLLFAILDPQVRQHIHFSVFTSTLLAINLGLMLNRLAQRMICVSRVYGVPVALTVPISWPVANVVNALASVHALKQDTVSRITKVSVKWAKTEHELPEFFGEPATSASAP